ncbi:YopT-type cysteine protease domain-containing protein, partial [Ralstonia solanacearum]
MRTNGDNHAIATHQSGNHVHVFDPNHGEYRLCRSELKDG